MTQNTTYSDAVLAAMLKPLIDALPELIEELERLRASSQEVFVPQSKFCKRAGISVNRCKVMRDAGYVPYIGDNPVIIPLYEGLRGVVRYAWDFSNSERQNAINQKKAFIECVNSRPKRGRPKIVK